MSEERLQGKDIAAGAEVGNCERMAKPMGMTLLHAGLDPQCIDHLAQAIFIQGVVAQANEQWGVRILPIFAFSQVAPDNPPDGFAEVNKAAFATLGSASLTMPDIDLTSFFVHVTNTQRAKLGGAQAGIQQNHD